jgi:putative FmdB family regulatory protein
MPTYEYACKDCGHTFEVVRSMHDEPLTICPNCGGSLRKVFAPPAIAFKGSGFYATDHGKKKKAAAPAAVGGGTEREGGKPGGGKPEGGKQGRPATGGDGAGKSGSSTAKEGSSSGGATESGAS